VSSITTDQGILHYEVYGRGKPVILLHGWLGSWGLWQETMTFLGQYYRTYALDFWGFGESGRKLDTYLVNDFVALVDQFMDKLGIESAPLVGHSMGGALSTVAASEVKLEGLILAAPYYRITSPWYLMLPAETLINTFSPLVRWVYRTQDMLPVNRPEAKPEIVSYNWVPSAAGRMAIGLAAQARDPKVLKKITMPTLLLHSRIDTVTDPKASLMVYDQLPTREKRAVWLKTSDHIIFWDYERDQVADEVLAFLDMIRRS